MANRAPNTILATSPQVLYLVVSTGHSYWVKNGNASLQNPAKLVKRAELVAGRGIRGDRYFEKRPNHTGQVTLMTIESIDAIRREFNVRDLPVTVFRRNVIVSPIDLDILVGQVFQIQGVKFEGAQECRPCQWMDRVVADGARRFMEQKFRGGLRAKVLSDGIIEAS